MLLCRKIAYYGAGLGLRKSVEPAGVLIDVLLFGRCGHVFDLLMQHSEPHGHNTHREDKSQPQLRALAQMGFPASGIDRRQHYITFALPKLVFAAAFLVSGGGDKLRFALIVAADHRCQYHPGRLVGVRDRGDLRCPASQSPVAAR